MITSSAVCRFKGREEGLMGVWKEAKDRGDCVDCVDCVDWRGSSGVLLVWLLL